jgi:hypothetical protein
MDRDGKSIGSAGRRASTARTGALIRRLPLKVVLDRAVHPVSTLICPILACGPFIDVNNTDPATGATGCHVVGEPDRRRIVAAVALFVLVPLVRSRTEGKTSSRRG